MAELKADTDELRRRAATIQAVGADHVEAGALDASAVESQIEAFGEINKVLHDDWRGTKGKQSRAWIASGQHHEGHSANLNANAFGYDGQDATSAQNLRTTE